ncbi:MAG: diguanylate cyclase, partial [Bacillota bacterium]
ILDDISKLNTKLSNTQRKLVKKNKIIEQNHKKFQLIIQNIGFGLILINQSGDIIISNSNFENTFGFIENILKFLKDENTEVYKNIKKSLKNLEPIKFNSIKLNNYINRYYEINLSFFDKKIEEYKYAIFTIKDITENRLNYLKVLKFKKAFYQSNDPVVITDINNKIKNVNKAFMDLYKFKKDELINQNINKFIKQIDLDEVSNKEIIYNKDKFGKVFPVDISVSTVKNNEESFSKIFIIVNINDYIKYQKKLKKLAHKDLMTETFNRQAGLRILKNTINKAYEEDLTILFLDINGLKKVNDSLGHSKGDLLIKKVTRVVKDIIRQSDVVVRFGGDEFLVILKNADLEIGKDIKKRINIELKNIDKYDFNIYVSIGVCEYNKDKFNTLTEFIEKADQKMYIEKEQFYNNENKNIIKK